MSSAGTPKITPGAAVPKVQPGGPSLKGKGKKGGGGGGGGLIPIWVDTDTAKFLVRALTAALEGDTQPKKKTKK
jgi:hypothetical protein